LFVTPSFLVVSKGDGRYSSQDEDDDILIDGDFHAVGDVFCCGGGVGCRHLSGGYEPFREETCCGDVGVFAVYIWLSSVAVVSVLVAFMLFVSVRSDLV